MPVFSAAFSAISVAAAQDLWEIVAPTGSDKVTLRELRIGQYSDFGDAQAELISIQLIRGYTTSGSGGAAVTPVNLESASRAAQTTVERNNTTVATAGTGSVLLADSFNVASGFWYRPPEDERIVLISGERLVVRISLPTDAITTNSTIIFEEGRR